MNGSMASSCATSSSPVVSAPSACPSSKKTAAARLFRRRRTVSCRATGGGGRGDNDGLLWLPRRDVMLTGLSGVAAGLAWYPGLASAADSACNRVDDEKLECKDTDDTAVQKPCPLRSEGKPKIFNKEDFKPSATRVRQPVHLLCPEYEEKYKEAVGKMMALDKSNPLRFSAQAAIHQAYCDSYYRYQRRTSSSAGSGSPASETKEKDPIFDVHFSWIFAPWHRMYIYFYERALGQLIGDDTFALPFWSWDAPAGMVVPPLFKKPMWMKPNGSTAENPLYDPNRNKPEFLDALLDLGYFDPTTKSINKNLITVPFEGPHDAKYDELLNKNLCTIYKQQQEGETSKNAVAFLGEKYCPDIDKATSMGTLESMAHTSMHIWVGRAGVKDCNANSGGVPNHKKAVKGETGQFNCNNDMGFLGSAANDPLFYSHHSNVDRMWHIWSKRGGGKGFGDDQEWLDTSFIFYDDVESPKKVRISIRDVLNTSDLGYEYAVVSNEDLMWLKPKITSLNLVVGAKSSGAMVKKRMKRAAKDTEVKFPCTLVQNHVVEVPAVKLPEEENNGKELVLVIDGIDFDPQVNNKFDVAINVPADLALKVGPQYKEYAGSFAVVPGSGVGTRQGKLSLCITRVLADAKAAGAKTVDVVIVPRTQAKVKLNNGPTIQYRK